LEKQYVINFLTKRGKYWRL